MRLFNSFVTLFWMLSIVFVGCQNDRFDVHVMPKIYDEEADARQDIEMALRKAQIEGKRVLLMFGGNWCPWCHRMHHLFKTDSRIKKLLERHYILVMIHVGNDTANLDTELNEKYGDPFQYGFPVLVMLDKDGKQLTTQETGSLEKESKEGEEKGHDPERVLAFLERWK